MSDRHYLLIYDLAPDYLDRRGGYRVEHLELARAAVARGELVLGGALADPADQAVLLFKGEGPEAAEAFARADPYVTNDLVATWKVRPWTTVIGPGALTRIT
ncbi:MAG: YciI-like protein [Alphaproteobacteria bacterium]|nr:YciI-like protein [Alphaproteobacteria bacterium]